MSGSSGAPVGRSPSFAWYATSRAGAGRLRGAGQITTRILAIAVHLTLVAILALGLGTLIHRSAGTITVLILGLTVLPAIVQVTSGPLGSDWPIKAADYLPAFLDCRPPAHPPVAHPLDDLVCDRRRDVGSTSVRGSDRGHQLLRIARFEEKPLAPPSSEYSSSEKVVSITTGRLERRGAVRPRRPGRPAPVRMSSSATSGRGARA